MIRCLLFFLLLSLHAVAQKKSTQAEVNKAKQMQEQMEKELKELEEENPELAKQARAMLNARTKAGQTTASKPPSAPVKSVSPVTSINLKLPVAPPAAAQATDKLLWFKGKKIDPLTLITTTGTIVRYNKAKNEAVVQPPLKTDLFNDIAKELSKNEQRKNEFINEVSGKKNSFFFYPAILKSLKEYDNIAERYSSIIKNTVSVPPSLSQNTGFLKSGGGGATYIRFKISDDIPEAARKLYNEVLHEMENAPALDVPIPPSREFDVCFDCDTNAQKKYDKAVDNWADKFLEYERNLVHKAISVQKEIAEIRNNAEAEEMWADMSKANQFAFSRSDKKVAMLQEQYGKDFSRVSAIIQLSLGVERQKQLLGVTGDAGNDAMQKIVSMLDGFDEYMQHQLDIKNYNTVFNIAFIIGMERQKQLLGASEAREIPFLNTFFAFNRFKLTMDMDFDLMYKDSEGEPNLKANGTTATTQNVYVSLGLVDCKFQFFLTNTDYENAEESEYRIPLTIKSGTKSVKEEHDKWVTYSYSGPKDMLAVFPTSRISFCDSRQPDSMYVEIIRYKTDDLSGYTQSAQKGYTIDFLGYANNLFMRPSQLEGSVDEAKNIGMEMMKTFSSSQLEQPTGNAQLDKMQADYNMVVKQQELQMKLSATAMMPKTLILFDARNNDNVVIDAETNTAHKEGQMDLVKGIIKVKVVHDPLPYDKPAPRKPLKKTGT